MCPSQNPFWEDLLAGCVCGLTTVIVSHPIETLSVQKRINSPEVYQNIFHSFRLIYRHQGLIDGFYRGNLSLPLISPAFLTAIQFFLYGQMKRYFVKNDTDAINKYLLSGALTGFGTSFFETPIGLIFGQIHGNLHRRHTHVFDFRIRDCCKHIYENSGLRGFYKGFFATLISSTTTSMFYFGGYEYVMQNLYQKHSGLFGYFNKKQQLRLNILLSGAVGGFVACSICYPLHIIKSELQSDELRPGHRKYVSYIDCIKQTYEQHHSLRTFYRGFFPAIIKAIPINAACFLAYEEVCRLSK